MKMSEHDQRQYQLMTQCIKGFEISNLDLRVLISSLKGLVDTLQEAEEEWKSSFRSEWWTLEEVYAVASDQGRNHLKEQERELVYEAIDEIKQLLQQVVNDELDKML
jgi:hypothetical protein